MCEKMGRRNINKRQGYTFLQTNLEGLLPLFPLNMV